MKSSFQIGEELRANKFNLYIIQLLSYDVDRAFKLFKEKYIVQNNLKYTIKNLYQIFIECYNIKGYDCLHELNQFFQKFQATNE